MIGRLSIIFTIMLTDTAAPGAAGPGRFAGHWKTTLGPVRVEQGGGQVTGKIDFYGLKLQGRVRDDEPALGYDEGQVHVARGPSWSGAPFTASIQPW